MAAASSEQSFDNGSTAENIPYNTTTANDPQCCRDGKFGDAAGVCPQCLQRNSDEESDESDTLATTVCSATDDKSLLPGELIDLGRIHIKLDSDAQDCHILGIDLTQDGNLLLADHNNHNIKLFTYTGQLLSVLALPYDPHDVSVVDRQTAAASLTGKRIGVIDISNTYQLSLQRIISLDYYIMGISSYRNYLIVTADESSDFEVGYRFVMMLNMSGDLIWMTKFDDDCDGLFERAYCLAIQRDLDCDTVIVTDELKETISVLDARSGAVVKVIESEEKTPCGVTIDNRGNVYVCHDSGEISVWGSDMQEDQCLAIGNVDFPHAMVYDRSRSELFISSLSFKFMYSDYLYRYRLE